MSIRSEANAAADALAGALASRREQQKARDAEDDAFVEQVRMLGEVIDEPQSQVPTPTPTQQPQSPEPAPAPLPSGNITVGNNVDWSALQPGKTYEFDPGDYAPPKPFAVKPGVILVAREIGKTVIRGVKGSETFYVRGVDVTGFWFRGGGLEKKANDKSAVYVEGKGGVLRTCLLSDAYGVGYTLGDDAQALDVDVTNCGSAAAGAKGDRWKILGGTWTHCNHDSRDTDGGGIKLTRSLDYEIGNLTGRDILGSLVWADINNGKGYIHHVHAEDMGTPNPDKPWLGNAVKIEIGDPGGDLIEIVTATRCNGPAILIEETPGVTVRNCRVDTATGSGKDKDGIHFRQNTRADVKDRSRSKSKNAWQLRDAQVYGCSAFTDGAELVIGTSAANVEPVSLKTLGQRNVIIRDNVRQKFRNIK